MITVGQATLLALGCWVSGIVFVAAMTSTVPDLKKRVEFKMTGEGSLKHLLFTLLGFGAGWVIGYLFSSIVGPALTESLLENPLPTGPIVVDVKEVIHNYAIMFGLMFTFLVSLIGSMILLTYRKED